MSDISTDDMLLYIKGILADASQEDRDLFFKLHEAQLKLVRGEKDNNKKAVKMLALAYTVQVLGDDD